MPVDFGKTELDETELLGWLVEQSALSLRTEMLAECVNFDEDRNTVTVQPLIMRKLFKDEKAKPIPPIQNVPVAYYGAGDVTLTFKPQKGDVCVLHIIDRSIEQWKNKGGVTDPQRSRHHNMNDAVAYFGLNEYGRAYKNLKGGFDMRTRDGQTSLHLEQGVIDFTVDGVQTGVMTSSLMEFFVPVKAPVGDFTDSLLAGGDEVVEHTHGGISRGGANTDPL